MAFGAVLSCKDDTTNPAAPPVAVAQSALSARLADDDRAVLEAFYQATDGSGWKNRENWLTDAPLGEWHGVETDGRGQVVGLRLSDNHLSGPIPLELGNLARLVTLWLSKNDLLGAIPAELGNLRRLRLLWLDDNHLSGPIPLELAQLPRLESLGLSKNELSGAIPTALGGLARLESLGLDGNDLSGPIPPELGGLARLESLGLDGNDLSGPIPPELGGLARLEWMTLHENDLTGSIPAALGNLASLELLWLSGNDLSGPIPPEMGQLTKLESLFIDDNNLSGAIPGELGGLARLEWMTLHENDLSGPIPPEMRDLDRLRFLSYEDTDLCMPAFNVFVTWRNRMERVTGEYCNRGDRDVLVALYAATGGDTWSRSDGWLGDGPVLSGWHGVMVDELGRVAGLDLSSNNLIGILPRELGQLRSMGTLAVAENPLLDGPLPFSLVHVPLDTLRFEGTGVCAPPELGAWMDAIRMVKGTGEVCAAFTDRQVLSLLYEATGGEGWTRSTNWLTDVPLDQWHGVVVNEDGRVTRLLLRDNNLTGPVPLELSYLSELEYLHVPQNALTGEIPAEFGGLSHLLGLNLAENRLTGPVPTELRDLEFLEILSLHHNELSGSIPSEFGDLSHLSLLNLSYNSLTGPVPVALRNLEVLRVLTLNHNELSGSIPPQLGDLKALEHLHLETNALTGTIPPEFGQLLTLKSLGLSGNTLTGPIPPQLGNLRELSRLNLAFNELSGPIPPEFGQLTTLESLDLGGNRLSGSVPHQFGELGDLEELWLGDNEFSGPIPPELGQLEELQGLYLYDNEFSDLIPPELGNLVAIRWLSLDRNNLSGPLPPEFGTLDDLKYLGLSFNEALSGPLPATLTRLDSLEVLLASDTELCAPPDARFQAWLGRVVRHRLSRCLDDSDGRGAAYLVQAVQSRNYPVPLVAGRDALLRVFLTAPRDGGVPIPPVRARFHVGNEEVYSAEIQGKPGPLPPEIDEGNLEISANVRIPGEVLRPGLEMVVEIDPDGTMEPDWGIPRRLPADGRAALDVQTLPTMELTVIPFLWTEAPDSIAVYFATEMAADPSGSELLGPSRAWLPVSDWDVMAHEPVWSSTNNAFRLLSQTAVIRAMEGGRGYWQGIMRGAVGAGGVAEVGGWHSFAQPYASTMAHELGHNMGLWHAPCGDPSFLDLGFPYSFGQVGAWGYDFATSQLVRPGRLDFMSYCNPRWTSDYHFSNALRHRLAHEAQPPAQVADRALLLWGGTDSDGDPHLEPAFLVNAPLSLPDSAGDYQLTGRDAGDREIFALSFAMPATADAEGAWSSFAFVLPVRPGWEDLATVTLTAPSGETAVLDGGTDRPATILRDSRTGRVRGILDGASPASWVSADRSGTSTTVGVDVLTSRGIPGPEAWRRN